MATVFSGLSRPYTIVRAGQPERVDLGVTIPAVPTISFVASLSATTSDALKRAFGADAQTSVLKGECLSPATLPDGVTVGFTAPLTWAGVEGTLTIVEIVVDPFGDILDEVVGQAFFATFHAPDVT